MGRSIRRRVSDECQPHLPHGEQSAAENGCVLSPRGRRATTHARVHARRLLGGGRERDGPRRADAVA